MINEDEEVIDYESCPMVTLQEIIFDLEDNLPKDKRTILYKEKVKELNNLFITYNKRSQLNCFKLIK